MFPFKTALNASTLFPFKLDVRQQITVAAEAGYEGIELWVRDIEAYLAEGGTVGALRAFLSARGIALVNAIAFWAWADSDPAKREEGFRQAETEMQMLAELGCVAVAAPPFGSVEGVALDDMAAQFARLSELGQRMGIEPYLEFWGRAKTLSRLSEAVYVAMQSGRPDAKLLLDPFHMYTGGSDIGGLAYLSGAAIGIVHMNDYPASPGRETITDAQRVFPGEGIAPLSELARLLAQAGYTGYLSLELFLDDYGSQSALDVAKRGLAAIQTACRVEG